MLFTSWTSEHLFSLLSVTALRPSDSAVQILLIYCHYIKHTTAGTGWIESYLDFHLNLLWTHKHGQRAQLKLRNKSVNNCTSSEFEREQKRIVILLNMLLFGCVQMACLILCQTWNQMDENCTFRQPQCHPSSIPSLFPPDTFLSWVSTTGEMWYLLVITVQTNISAWVN